jgi:hypothetical protein
MVGTCELDASGSGQGPESGSYEHETSGSIKAGKFLTRCVTISF